MAANIYQAQQEVDDCAGVELHRHVPGPGRQIGDEQEIQSIPRQHGSQRLHKIHHCWVVGYFHFETAA